MIAVYDRMITMRLSGVVYRHLLESELNAHSRYSANSVARELDISPNTVSLAVRALSAIGAAVIYRRSFEITSFDKAIMYWAATRKLKSDIVYKTFVGRGASFIEKNMPGETACTAYSGYVNIFGNDVSDYGEVYVYATEKALEDIKERFPGRSLSAKSDYSDLIVLRCDKILEKRLLDKDLKGPGIGLTQIYVDLWNINGWQAEGFFEKLSEKIKEARMRALKEGI
jgi:hypothetical protein